MNTQRIADVNRKLPGGTEVIFNGKIAYVEHDRQDGYINLRPTKEKNHKEDDTFLISKSEIKLSPKLRAPISAKPKPATEKQIKDQKDMNAFFDSLADKIPFNCSNCRKPLYAFSKKAKRCVCSHILPKAVFECIATDPDNIYFLGVDFIGCPCDCHDRWGKNVDSRKHKDMSRVYHMSIRRYQEKLIHKLSPKEQIMAAEYLGITNKSGNLAKDIAEGKA